MEVSHNTLKTLKPTRECIKSVRSKLEYAVDNIGLDAQNTKSDI